ncbi:MAG: Nif3-like dinuclear metal center hexameric protein [Gammaproteobacteria bacterium]|nr:Nif3-like dinuclear metal center hexameric protein [Gammaproteobacteria bacterium]
MTSLNDIVKYTNDLLNIDQFRDYCPNGLQVQGKAEIEHIVAGVTASKALIEKAIDIKADAMLVHHGYFWKGENPVISGMKYDRLKALIEAGISLIAYHLPLDAHPVYGNNAQLAERLGFKIEGGFAKNGNSDIAQFGQLSATLSANALSDKLEAVLDRKPFHIAGNNRKIQSVGWCTGAAQNYIEDAAALGLDAYITGEASEQTFHAANELGIHFFACGHHATERYGVQALGVHISEHFGLKYTFIDIDNPI